MPSAAIEQPASIAACAFGAESLPAASPSERLQNAVQLASVIANAAGVDATAKVVASRGCLNTGISLSLNGWPAVLTRRGSRGRTKLLPG